MRAHHLVAERFVLFYRFEVTLHEQLALFGWFGNTIVESKSWREAKQDAVLSHRWIKSEGVTLSLCLIANSLFFSPHSLSLSRTLFLSPCSITSLQVCNANGRQISSHLQPDNAKTALKQPSPGKVSTCGRELLRFPATGIHFGKKKRDRAGCFTYIQRRGPLLFLEIRSCSLWSLRSLAAFLPLLTHLAPPNLIIHNLVLYTYAILQLNHSEYAEILSYLEKGTSWTEF